MWLSARLTSAKFTTRSWRCATGWTANSEQLFWSEVSFHNWRMMTPNQCAGMVNVEQL